MRFRAAIIVLALFAVSACNSTNRLQSADEVADGVDAPVTTDDSVSTTAAPGAGDRPAQVSSGGGAGPADSGGVGSSGGSTAPGGAVATDKTPIRLGIITLDLGGAEVILSGLGTQVSFGDGQAQTKAVVDEMNAKGGIGGRKIIPFYAEVDASDSSGASYIAGCTKLTEDDKVFAILTPLNVSQDFVECVARHKTPLINFSFNPGDDGLFQMYRDYFFSPSLMSLDRGSKLMLQNLKASGGLGSGQKVGLFTFNEPQLIRVSNHTVKPLLTSWKVPFVEVVAEEDADVSEAVLRFRTEGVTRVIFEAPNGIAQILFMNQAQSQRYTPKYSFWDPDSPRFVSETAPQSQVRNITGIGALPLSDVPPREYPPGPAEKRCIDILNKRGYRTQNRNSNITATLYCEGVWVFAEAAKRVNGPLTVGAWRTAYRSIGTSYDPVSTFGADFSTGRNDNASHYRKLAFVDDCDCMRFSGPSIKAP